MSPVAPLSPQMLAGAIKARARELKFDLVGIAPAHASEREPFWRRWAAEGRAGDMAYMVRRLEERIRPETYFPGVRSAICVAVNYHVPLEPPPPDLPAPGRIARYALTTDYHDTIRDRLFALADYVRQACPDAQTKCAVDTAPVAERELAARAGIGWVGKNTCILSPKIGSWLFLGTVLTTADLPADHAATDRCGTCTRCLQACPTGALTPERPYELNPLKCISYLTIEHRAEVPQEYHAPIGDWLYGCDICQDVCPWNRKAPASTDPAFQPRIPSGRVSARDVLDWSNDQWLAFTKKTAIRRLGLPLFKRNAAIVVQNSSAHTSTSDRPPADELVHPPADRLRPEVHDADLP